MAFKMAVKSISSSKVRSFLTMLGIIIGVSAVIILISVVQGATKNITDQLKGMGTNLINVMMMRQNQSSRRVTVEDFENLAFDNPDLISGVSPMISSSVTVKYENSSVDTSLNGISEFFRTARNTDVQSGRFITATDVSLISKVALIGEYQKTELFGGESPEGKVIKVNGTQFTVVGVIEKKSTGGEGTDDDRILIPYTTAMRLVKNTNVSSYSIEGADSEKMTEAMDLVSDMLLKIYGDTNAYRVMNQADMLENVNQMTGMLTGMLGGIAGISLLVGGIGIMNIMLVSVTERTREIGIRKAIGAKKNSIMTQFLIEAIVVSCMGGIIGIALGIGGAYLIGKAIDIEAQPGIDTILYAFAFAAGVGIFFGWWPANKAARLNPIEALRFE